MARWFQLPGGGTASFASLMRTHRAWFDQARARSMDWENIRRYLRDVGITTETGEAFPLSSLTAADTRYRADVRSGKITVAAEPADALPHGLDAAPEAQKRAPAEIAKPSAIRVRRPQRGHAISQMAELAAPRDVGADRLDLSSSEPSSTGRPAALLAAMKRSARLRDRDGSDEL
ncbi:hypothetical protein [Hansschlegelia sp. KR7-227]|uniref:hypothetical protein n=1 Tax=Hansschlegelia sp. KR7-227 TaxID=3400914 RepID=UPI003C11A079